MLVNACESSAPGIGRCQHRIIQADVANRPLYVLHELQHTSAQIFAQPTLGGTCCERFHCLRFCIVLPRVSVLP